MPDPHWFENLVLTPTYETVHSWRGAWLAVTAPLLYVLVSLDEFVVEPVSRRLFRSKIPSHIQEFTFHGSGINPEGFLWLLCFLPLVILVTISAVGVAWRDS